ncbi:MAG: hypothetical protein WB992_03620 [Bryobacteraceae bacterium]
MKKLFTSTLLTVAAVPFLMAAPTAAKKVQNPAAQSTAAPKAHKKHVKKNASKSTDSNASAPAASSPKQ